jgi:tetratricopeptide (TPR) repeat protein/transcriptional regulator with XRE-family HTH domain
VAGQSSVDFAGLLRQLRAEAGLTQEELAQAAGLGLRTISDLERGAHRTAHQDTARLLADVLGLAEPARGFFVAAARGRATAAAEVLAARRVASTAALAAMIATGVQAFPAAPVPRELPADVTAFTGRDLELAELDLLLPIGEADAGEAGPVVITAVAGMAGVGKTALAVRWAHRVQGAFPGGQLYVNLRGYDPLQPLSAGDALARFLRSLGMADQDIPLETEERAARYRSLVIGKRMLVVLDNAASEEQVRPLLPGSSSVVMLVTSRSSLAGLVAREGARRLDLDLLPPGEAIQLLTTLIGERAEADLLATRKLAALCAYLPLALRVAAELAAVRRDTPLAKLAVELARQDDRLDLLDAGGDPRSAVAEVFSWSYRHLASDAAWMFRLLGLHPSQDWDQYAAAALTAADSLAQVRRLLGVLARAHLIQIAGADRYQMHDLLRAHAASLAGIYDNETTRQEASARLFDYYLAASAAAMDILVPAEHHRRPSPPAVGTPLPPFKDQTSALDWLNAERATLLTIATHAANRGWPSHATRLASTLYRYLYREHDTEGMTIHAMALEAARATGDRAAEAQALTGLVSSHWAQGRFQQAVDLGHHALAVADEADDQLAQANALVHIAASYEGLGRVEPALEYLRRAVALYRELGDHGGEAMQLANLGHFCFEVGRSQEGINYVHRALALAREVDDQNSMAAALYFLGDFHSGEGRYQQAADAFSKTLLVARQSGLRMFQGVAHGSLGIICHRQGRYDQAANHYQQALSIHRELGNQARETITLNDIGQTLLATGQYEQARTCHATALALARQTDFAAQQARALTGLGDVSRREADYDQASDYYQRATAQIREIGNPWLEAETINSTGENLLAMGQPDQARACHISALALSRRTGDRYQQARAHRSLATACRIDSQLDQAHEHWQHALDIYTELGVPEASQMRDDFSPTEQPSTGTE